MTWWERFRYWLAGLIWPGLLEANAKIEGLQGRLAFTHKRMQEMYWEEKAKEMALARIAGLQEALEEACNVMYGSGSSQDSVRKFAEEAGISWTPENYERWRAKPPALEEAPGGLAFDHPGRHGTFHDPGSAPSVLFCAAVDAPNCGDPRCPIHGEQNR